MASSDAGVLEHSGGEDGAEYDSSDGAVPRCPHCDFEATSRLALVAHLAECGGDGEGRSADGREGSPDRMNRKMFECDVCNMKFSNGANMRRHKMRHTGVKPYECRICQKRFFRKDHLAEHVTIHTKTLPYHCPICARGFQRQIAMRAHFQNEHVGLHDVVKSCPLCSFQVPSLKGLRAHFLHRHGIDLDNPGRSMAVDKNGNATAVGATSAQGISQNHFQEGDGALCGEASTPPMHFLTPHIEISMADPANSSSQSNGDDAPLRLENSQSPGPGDAPKKSPGHGEQASRENGGVLHMNGGAVSVITVKQEPGAGGADMSPTDDDEPGPLGSGRDRSAPGPVNLSTGRSADALIKVSPLKSLLQDDSGRRSAAPSRIEAAPASLGTLPVGRPIGTANDSACGTAWRLQRLQCVYCGIAFPDQTLYFLHKGCHADNSPWRCNICGEQCGGVYDFNAHLLSKAHQ